MIIFKFLASLFDFRKRFVFSDYNPSVEKYVEDTPGLKIFSMRTFIQLINMPSRSISFMFMTCRPPPFSKVSTTCPQNLLIR